MRSKRPGICSICQLSSWPISLRCAAAQAGALFGVQFVYVRGDGQIFEVGQMAPSLAAFDPPQFLFRLGMRRNVVRVDWLAIQFLAEAEQQLRQIACRLEPVCAWPVVPLLVATQLYLQALVFDQLPVFASPRNRSTSPFFTNSNVSTRLALLVSLSRLRANSPKAVRQPLESAPRLGGIVVHSRHKIRSLREIWL